MSPPFGDLGEATGPEGPRPEPSAIGVTYFDGPNEAIVDMAEVQAPHDKAPLVAEALAALLPHLVPALVKAFEGGRDPKAEIEAAKDTAEAAAIVHELLKFHR